MPKQANGFHADQLKFIEWLATPKTERQPKTQKEYAKKNGVDEGTLSDWKRLPGFLDNVTAIARFQLKDALTDIYTALVRRAIDGDVQAIKLALEVSGEYLPKQKIDLDIDVTKLSDDELRAIAEGKS